MAVWVILSLISAIYLLFLPVCCITYFRSASQKAKIIRLPKFMFWLGAITGSLFLILSWLVFLGEQEYHLAIFFSFFTLLGDTLMLGWKNCCISYDQTGFVQKNFLGKQRSFTYDQVTAWFSPDSNPIEAILYLNNKKITFNLLHPHAPYFVATFHTQYRKSHNGQHIPMMRIPRNQRSQFCAHVHNPGEYLTVFIMLLVFVLGIGIWLCVDTWLPVKSADSQKFQICYSSWSAQEDQITLYSPQAEEVFIIRGTKEYLSHAGQLKENCDGHTVFLVWADRKEPDDADPYYLIYAISSENVIYRTFEDSTAYKRRELPEAIAFLGFSLGILLVFSGLTYVIGSYPQKFPKWIVYCFFKKNAIDF